MSDGLPGPAPEINSADEWQRLDPLMLLVHPVRELIRFLPALIVVTIAGTASGEAWQLLAVLVPVAIGLARYLTTSYRVSEGRIELRRGLISRHILSTPVDRVRTVDLTSSLIHRVLGLTTLRIGTGTASTSSDEVIDLDGLTAEQARALRESLLGAATGGEEPGPDAATAPVSEELVAIFEPAWLRFAPLTGSGIVIAAAAIGVSAQFLELLGVWDQIDTQDYEALSGPSLPLLVLIPLVLVVAVVVTSALAVVGYLINNWDFRISRRPAGPGGDWHLVRGLFTTRETTLDADRVAGVSLTEPLAVRAMRGGRLSAIVTGLDRSQSGSSTMIPPAPLTTVERAAIAVLGDPEPVHGIVRPHGPAAVRRRWTRALAPTTLLAAMMVALVVTGESKWLLLALLGLPMAAALAADRSRSLGHLLTHSHLVSRSGSMVRRRRVIDVEHVIGWNLRATWFQRRVGLTTLVATTAGGSQAVPVLDIPEQMALEVADQALPGLLSQFLR
ncbi:PH domain-containing protein [Nocardioides sp.]|uniref:PH domain-containing protein n=1 Tax=Nocardioides sp. TaxID=35761 RepID=UPI00356A356F